MYVQIHRCSIPGEWYHDLIGKILTVAYVVSGDYYQIPEGFVPKDRRCSVNVVSWEDGYLLYEAEEYDALKRERDNLRAEFEQRKPVLSREVAEAIAKRRHDSVKDTAILMDASVWNWNTMIVSANTIRDFAIQGDNIFRLADALRYGYTIKEQTIIDEIVAIIDDCGDDRRRLADRLTDLFETRLEQERVKSG